MPWIQRPIRYVAAGEGTEQIGGDYYNTDTGQTSSTRPSNFDPYAEAHALGLQVDTSTANPSYWKNGVRGIYAGGEWLPMDQALAAARAGGGGFVAGEGGGDIANKWGLALQSQGTNPSADDFATKALGIGIPLAGAAIGAGGAGLLGPSAAGAGPVAGGMMPAAVPPVDPTFGGMLTQTAPGVYSNLANAAAFGPIGTSSLPNAGMDLGMFNPNQANPYVTGASAPGATAGLGGITAPGAGATAAGAAGVGGTILDGLKTAAPYAPLLGAALGAGAGMLSGGSKPAGNITVTEDIPDWLKAYMKPTMDKYSSLIQNYNTDPYGVMPSAMQEFKNTINGNYLDPATNKYLEQYFNLGAERVKGSLSPSFGHMQAFGQHSGYNEALSRGLGDLATGLYGGAYEKERDRQANAMAAAPNFLTGASQSAFAPYQSYMGSFGGLGKKQEKPYFDNPFGNIVGGAMAGYGLGKLF